VVKFLVLLVAVVVLLPYVVTPFYRFTRPVSTLMLWRALRGETLERQWIDLSRMSPYLPAAVVAAEDARFCQHQGVDWQALEDALDDEGGRMRGASTITQQVAKNLFLWPGRDPLRKLLELPLALWIDLVLPKERILEIYLNIAELGPRGQFGVEAGSRYAFGRSAATLSAREAATLAAILPNPLRRSARAPTMAVRRLASIYRVRSGVLGARCWSGGRDSWSPPVFRPRVD